MKRFGLRAIAPTAPCAFAVTLLMAGVVSGQEPASIVVQGAAPGLPVAPTMFGLFFEDINYGADGGLYAELVENRSFEHGQPLHGWNTVARGAARGEARVERGSGLHPNNPGFLRLRLTAPGEGGYGVMNAGFDGIPVEEGERCRFSIHARMHEGAAARMQVLLEDADDGTVLARQSFQVRGEEWKQYRFDLRAERGDTEARLVLLLIDPGAVDMDMVSLFPEHTFKGRENGLRADLARALADMKPGFLRFPGGCIVEGRDSGNRYRWKDTVGPVTERKQNYNLWQNRESPQYHQTYGLGFFEYFQFAEDIGAEPVPVVNCGMCCQARRGPHVPLDELESYVQDALDLVEFANGSPATRWGALRKSMGHPKPFNLKYLAVGNEQWQQEYFDRYVIFQRAIKGKHPKLQIISSSGPLADDPLYHFAWGKFRSGVPADVVDEHYYVPPRWLLENVDRYASYDRNGPKVFVGEFAGHDRGRRNNLRSALAEAAYMTGLLRHSDVVIMASYAPLLARYGHDQWRPDLIWFDNTRTVLTPNYHVQALFSCNRPDLVLPTTVQAPLDRPASSGMIGVGTWNTQAEYKDIKVVSADGRTLFESDFSTGQEGWQTAGGNWQVVEGALRQAGEGENVRAVAGDPSWSEYTLTLKARKLGGDEGFLILFETPEINSPVWWNLGGWRNTEHGLQGEGLPERRIRGRIETGRWYDIRIESRAGGVKAYLDGELAQEGQRKPVSRLFAVAGRSGREVLLNVVNTSPEPQPTAISFNGIRLRSQTAKAFVLRGDADEENTLELPDTLLPVAEEIRVPGPEWHHEFPPQSLTVLRLRL